MITMKKIANLVNTQNAKINYYTFDENAVRNSIFYLKVLSEEDKVYYETMNNDDRKVYISESAQIYLPKISVDYCAKFHTENDPYSFEYTYNKVKQLENINNNDVNTAVALYMILHEFGHWNDFISKEKNVFLYTITDSEKAKKVWNYKIKIERLLKSKVANNNPLNKSDKELIIDYYNKYNDIPGEKRANCFADSHYNEAYAKLKKEGMVS